MGFGRDCRFRIAVPEPGVVVEEDKVAVVAAVPFFGEEDSHVSVAVVVVVAAAVEGGIAADVVEEERVDEEVWVPVEVQTEHPPAEVLRGLSYFPQFRLPI